LAAVQRTFQSCGERVEIAGGGVARVLARDQSSKRAALPVAAPKSTAFSNRDRAANMNALCA
jgi:hypothetical protein